MSINSIKRMLVGEKTPDKDIPENKERHEKDVAAGRRFAQVMHIDTFAAKIQLFAVHHSRAFLVIVFGFLFLMFVWNVYRIGVVSQRRASMHSAVATQDSLIQGNLRGNATNTNYPPK